MTDRREKNQILAIITQAQHTNFEVVQSSRLKTAEAIIKMITENPQVLKDLQSLSTPEQVFEFVCMRLFVTVGQPFSLAQEDLLENSPFRAGYLTFLMGLGRGLGDDEALAKKIAQFYISSPDFARGRMLGEEALALVPEVLGGLIAHLSNEELQRQLAVFCSQLQQQGSISKRAYQHAGEIVINQSQLQRYESTALAMRKALEAKGHVFGQAKVEVPVLVDEDVFGLLADEIIADLRASEERTSNFTAEVLIELAMDKVLTSLSSPYFLVAIMYGRHTEEFLLALEQFLVVGESASGEISPKDYSAQAGIMTGLSILETIEWVARSLAWKMYSQEYEEQLAEHDKAVFLTTLRNPGNNLRTIDAQIAAIMNQKETGGLFATKVALRKFMLKLISRYNT